MKPVIFLERVFMPTKEWRKRNRSRYREYQRRYFSKPGRKKEQSERMRAINRRVKLEVLRHYSRDLKCARCGFNDVRALSIDHINGGGQRQVRSGVTMLYHWLRRNNYPADFQVLCMNCQFIKREENKECKRDSAAGVWYAPKPSTNQSQRKSPDKMAE